MALHKDSNGQIHDDMDGAALHLLPVGCVLITQAEADALRAPTPEQVKEAAIAAIKGRINALEQSQSRAMREVLLGGPTDRRAALEAQIATERAELVKALA